MTRSWQFSDLEFVAIWETLRDVFLPAPFVFTARPHPHLDYERQKRDAGEVAWARVGDGFRTVLDAVARPDIRVMMRGFDGRRPTDPKDSLRVLAARRGHEGYLLTQLPGETIDHSGGYTVSECDPLSIAEAIVDELPAQDAGKISEVVLTQADNWRDEVDRSVGTSPVWAAAEEPVWHRSEEFLRLPVASIGLIEISQGNSRFGPRGRLAVVVGWRDVIGDGRYGIADGSPLRAVPADRRRMIALINEPIAKVVRAIKDERY
ncbi:ESX secretion-associated protein EspG [Nocardia sp. NPDC003963]